jgi:hypothetical protein
MGVRTLVVVAIAVVIGLAALAQASAAGGGAEGVPRFGHVFVIIGENTDYQHLTSTNAPYLMASVRPSSAWFENYYAATHWSQANYVALTSGRFTACEQADKGYACRDDVDNVFHQLDVARMSWKTWVGHCEVRHRIRRLVHEQRPVSADRLLHDGKPADRLHEHLVLRVPRERPPCGDGYRRDGHFQCSPRERRRRRLQPRNPERMR